MQGRVLRGPFFALRWLLPAELWYGKEQAEEAPLALMTPWGRRNSFCNSLVARKVLVEKEGSMGYSALSGNFGTLYERIRASVAFLAPHLKEAPELALILGSGLGDLAAQIDAYYEVSYQDIPGFCASNVSMHAGKLIFGLLEGRRVVCMQGRIHLYEGYAPEEVVYPLFVMHELGAQTLIVTNATGSLHEEVGPGSIVLITDQINATGRYPLTYCPEDFAPFGAEDSRQLYQPFCDMTDAYTPVLRRKAHSAAAACGISLTEGVYVATHGPQFETPAEIRAYRLWGADIVGMSTALEVIAARSLGMDVLGLSMVTNLAAGLSRVTLTGEDMVEVAERAGEGFARLLSAILADI